MKRPYRNIVIAYHLIWTAYGRWLPNDPRGSTSRTIATDVIAELGDLHHGRKRIQPSGRVIRDFYDRAKDVLKFELLTFTPEQTEIVAKSFAGLTDGRPYTCYACAILPDHVHVVIRKHKRTAEQMIEDLQEASRIQLQKTGQRPGHPVWGGPGWKVFLFHPDEVRRTIKYVNDNPMKMRLPRQDWEFVQEYDGWPLHKNRR